MILRVFLTLFKLFSSKNFLLSFFPLSVYQTTPVLSFALVLPVVAHYFHSLFSSLLFPLPSAASFLSLSQKNPSLLSADTAVTSHDQFIIFFIFQLPPITSP
ncbi:Uncharacterized protein TCM_006364 [Theobroma cacao]|uniref:Uncharacterized protein n=1 Tax=Theobroma cacao TaxID=3641 RepID=A0A061DWW4_THECC|nr:Uncharacterized protein TCM_006364 [Theobroma cacao]